MQFTFPYKLRICTEEQIKHILRRGRRIPSAEFTVIFCPNELTHARLGVIVSKKNIRRANRRHTFKRVIREFFRLQQHNLPATDVLILANKKAETLTKRELRQCIEQQWQKILKLLNK